jgi:hypothetical protein
MGLLETTPLVDVLSGPVWAFTVANVSPQVHGVRVPRGGDTTGARHQARGVEPGA